MHVTLSFYHKGRNWAYCCSTGSGFWDTSHFYRCLTVSAELMPWHGRPSSAKCVFSETVKQQINAKFCGKVAIHHISRRLFSLLKNLDFWILSIFSFSLTWDPIQCYRNENFKTLLLGQLLFFFNQTFSKISLWQSSQKLFIGILKFQIEKFLKKIKIFNNMGPYGSGNSKRYS